MVCRGLDKYPPIESYTYCLLTHYLSQRLKRETANTPDLLLLNTPGRTTAVCNIK